MMGYKILITTKYANYTSKFGGISTEVVELADEESARFAKRQIESQEQMFYTEGIKRYVDMLGY